MRLPLLALLLLPVLRARGEEGTTGIDISLIAENTSVTSSKPFTVALKVHHHAGFHTYWQNPGIVGVPFAIKWQLPPGFTAGEIQWPYPQPVDMAGHPAFGYERDILLLVDITPPADLAKGVKLDAEATWMACGKGCYPGKKTFSLTLPVSTGTTPDPDQASLFAKARAEIPGPLAGWTTKLESAPDAAEIRVKFTRAPGNASDPGKVRFFSSDGQISSDPPQRIEPLPDGFRLIAPRSEYGPKDGKTLPGVLIGENPLAPAQPVFARVTPSSLEATR